MTWNRAQKNIFELNLYPYQELLFLPKQTVIAKEMIIEKSISINHNIHNVFEFLKLTENQDQFNVWNLKDLDMKKTYTGTDGIRVCLRRDSKDKNVGGGAQETTNIIEDSGIDYELRFERPMKNIALASLALNKSDELNTSVSWSFRSQTKFPMSLFEPLFRNVWENNSQKGCRI